MNTLRRVLVVMVLLNIILAAIASNALWSS